jgi:chromosome segregation ATPase
LTTATKNKEEVEQLKIQKQNEVSTADANVKALREKLRNKEIEVSNTSKDISTLEYKIKNVDSQIQVNKGSQERIKGQIDQYSANVNEIDNIKKSVEVYQTIIADQSKRITELTEEVNGLREQLRNERGEYQRQIDSLQKQIIEITRVLGMQNRQRIRDERSGRFVPKKAEQ